MARIAALVTAAALTTSLSLAAARPAEAGGSRHFVRTATFPVYANVPDGVDPADETVAEISAVSRNGKTLVYTDSPGKRIGFVNISNPKQPKGIGTLSLAELGDADDEPTSVAVVGGYVLVVVNTSQSYTDPSGRLDVVRLSDRTRVHSIDLGGQPDSIAVSPDGKRAGDNSITIEEDGCLLIERWRGAQGGTGQSYNFYDPGMEKWRQVWVARSGTIDYAGALNDDGAMVLEGEIANRNGKTAPFKGTWTLQDDGSVRQQFQQFNAETGHWDDWFIGIYKRAEDENE